MSIKGSGKVYVAYQTTVPMFIIMKEHPSSVSALFIDVFLIGFEQQWRTMEKSDEINQDTC